MIWMTPMAGTEEGSVYFQIRDISMRQNGFESFGLISGLLGDGHQEVWAEVEFGKRPEVRILPLLTDSGQVESLSAAVDEELLKIQLLEVVQEVYTAFASRTAGPSGDSTYLPLPQFAA